MAMRVPVSWLKEYVDVGIDPKKCAFVISREVGHGEPKGSQLDTFRRAIRHVFTCRCRQYRNIMGKFDQCRLH